MGLHRSHPIEHGLHKPSQVSAMQILLQPDTPVSRGIVIGLQPPPPRRQQTPPTHPTCDSTHGHNYATLGTTAQNQPAYSLAVNTSTRACTAQEVPKLQTRNTRPGHLWQPSPQPTSISTCWHPTILRAYQLPLLSSTR